MQGDLVGEGPWSSVVCARSSHPAHFGVCSSAVSGDWPSLYGQMSSTNPAVRHRDRLRNRRVHSPRGVCHRLRQRRLARCRDLRGHSQSGGTQAGVTIAGEVLDLPGCSGPRPHGAARVVLANDHRARPDRHIQICEVPEIGRPDALDAQYLPQTPRAAQKFPLRLLVFLAVSPVSATGQHERGEPTLQSANWSRQSNLEFHPGEQRLDVARSHDLGQQGVTQSSDTLSHLRTDCDETCGASVFFPTE
ncbi:hypothetical protein LX86_001434 [Lentzea aerocolonigenes]|nr:hypothetical protein [Lentzea aerocolonigenes]